MSRSEERDTVDSEERRLSRAAVFNARVHADTGARPGQPISIAVDPRAFHFFDLETGENITPANAPEPVAA